MPSAPRLDAGQAQALLADDRLSPIRHCGRWYAVPAGSGDEVWLLVDAEESTRLNALEARLQTAGRSTDVGETPA